MTALTRTPSRRYRRVRRQCHHVADRLRQLVGGRGDHARSSTARRCSELLYRVTGRQRPSEIILHVNNECCAPDSLVQTWSTVMCNFLLSTGTNALHIRQSWNQTYMSYSYLSHIQGTEMRPTVMCDFLQYFS